MRGEHWRCKTFSVERIMTVSAKEVPANFVPAAAVIQKVRALFIVTGRKGYVGGAANFAKNPGVVTSEQGF